MQNNSNNINEYIASGILELYVLGVTDAAENEGVQQMAALHPVIQEEIEQIEKALEGYAAKQAPAPDPTIKPFVMAMIDYIERLNNGEPVSVPPILNEQSSAADYQQWIDRKDICLPQNFKDFHASIIGYSPEATTAIVWLQHGAPGETHHDELEKFLILEGTCDITIGDTVHQLTPGSYLSIPLYQNHHVRVTSSIPCKIILQRIAVAA